MHDALDPILYIADMVGISSLLIRSATLADIPALQAIERRANQVFLQVGYDFVADGPVRDEAEHHLSQSSGAALVAVTGGGPVGFALALPLDAEAHLLEIDVDPPHQRQGIARRLIETVEAWARSNKLAALTLTTYRDVAWNGPYYEKLGFERFDPPPARTGLAGVIAEEAEAGFAVRPRIVMRKVLP